jgi:hypothetical protein
VPSLTSFLIHTCLPQHLPRQQCHNTRTKVGRSDHLNSVILTTA